MAPHQAVPAVSWGHSVTTKGVTTRYNVLRRLLPGHNANNLQWTEDADVHGERAELRHTRLQQLQRCGVGGAPVWGLHKGTLPWASALA